MKLKPMSMYGWWSPFARFALVVALSLTLMTLEHRTQVLVPLRNVLSVIVDPLQYAVDLLVGVWDRTQQSLISHNELMTKNERLRNRLRTIQSQLGVINRLRAENLHLRNLLDASAKIHERVMIVDVLAVSVGRSGYHIRLNQGARVGIQIGQPVLDAYGVMGQIVKTGPFSSIALLITDPNHALPAQIKRTGARVIAVGNGQLNRLTLIHLPRNVDIRTGDELITSGLGGRFPVGYTIGTVVAVADEQGAPLAEIMVKPSATLDRSRREVLVVWLPNNPDASELVFSRTSVSVRP